MTKTNHISKLVLISCTLVIFLFSNLAYAQNEQQAGTPEAQPEAKKEKKDKKKKNEFKVYAGVNFSKLSLDSDHAESNSRIGWLLGGSYKQGRFFYWEVGARYNNAPYNFSYISNADSTGNGNFTLHNLDVPITGGINFLSFASRIVGLRLFISAVPSFTLSTKFDDADILADNINTFILYGQGGIGVDVAFLFIEAGFNYGFSDVFSNDITSKPTQIFLNLGFRF